MRSALQRLFTRSSVSHAPCDIGLSGRDVVRLRCCRYKSLEAQAEEVNGKGDPLTADRGKARNNVIQDVACDNSLEKNSSKEKETVGIGQHSSSPTPGIHVGKSNQQDAKRSEGNGGTAGTSMLSHDGRASRAKWIKRLSTFEQYKKESDIDSAKAHQPLLINDPSFASDYSLWLELIRFRRRHHGPNGGQGLFKEMFRRDITIPCDEIVGDELWELLIDAGHQDSSFLSGILSYSIKLKEKTGQAWPKLYCNLLVQALKTDPTLAYNLHVQLKQQFPPTIDDYRKLFRQCTLWNSVNDFEWLYRDLPLQGMYATVIPELCSIQRYPEALRWHDLLFTHRDLPSRFNHIHPLFAYLALRGDAQKMEQIANDLKEVYGGDLSVLSATEKFVRKHKAIGREIFNRQLGEVHDVVPKHLDDSFCARLFATKLFSVDTVIKGLQMIDATIVGPLSLREMALRDDCHLESIGRHLSQMRESGVSPDKSAFSLLLQRLVLSNKKLLLKSLIECDLHPDSFEDQDLQERLLVQYSVRDDHLQFERTLAAITIRCRSEDLLKWQLNLVLRNQISLRRTDAVMSTMQTMSQKGVPISSRTSRHLRVCWLQSRRPGRGAHSYQELSIIINTMVTTLRSGRHIPIIAWREIMRRLGMDGRLEEFEKLALWLADFYTNPPTQLSLPARLTVERNPSPERSSTNPQAPLKSLFTIAAQHAIVAWGFQQESKHHLKTYKTLDRLPFSRRRPLWMWGLILLHRLQAHGVPIHRSTIARICIHRFRILFGSGLSKRRANRRSVQLRTQRHHALDRWAFGFYVREVEKIWGRDLFQKVKLAGIVGFPRRTQVL